MIKKAKLSIPLGKQRSGFQNHILANLPGQEFERLSPELTPVSLRAEEVLHDVGDAIEYEYFPNTGLVSTLTVMSNGDSVEVGIVGHEGFTGLPLLLNIQRSSYRQNVQISGEGLRIRCDTLQKLLPETPNLERRISRYGYLLALHMAQIAACNRLHEIEERLARWLLMTSDRVSSDTLPLTHEFLANMLGSRRSSVTIAAGILHKAGIIDYSRGKLRIISRSALEESACECYETVREQLNSYLHSSGHNHVA